MPPSPYELLAFGIIFGRKSKVGSLIGGLPKTQEMLDFFWRKRIVSDIELIDIKNINAAYDRMIKGDVSYRFVINMVTL